MPRLTNSDYLALHSRLRIWWLESNVVFGLLGSKEQSDLHHYFNFATKQAPPPPPEGLILHRMRVSQEDPSLPQRAGRTVTKLVRLIAEEAEKQERRQHEKVAVPAGGERKLRVRSVMRPEPDIEKLGDAIIALAIELAREEQARNHKQAGSSSE